MHSSLFNKSTFFLTLFLAVVAVGVGVSAYSEPRDISTRFNTLEPIDVSSTDQVKLGGLSVYAFSARGNANFKKDLSIKKVAMGCLSGVCDATAKATTVTIGNDLLATGDLIAQKSFIVESLKHPTGQGLLPVCANEFGIIVFCPGSVTPPPPDLCPNIFDTQVTVPAGYTKDSDGRCVRTLDVTVQTVCPAYSPANAGTGSPLTNPSGLAGRLDFTFSEATKEEITLQVGAYTEGTDTNNSEGGNTTERRVYGGELATGVYTLPPQVAGASGERLLVKIPAGVTTYTAYPIVVGYYNTFSGKAPYYYECWGSHNVNAGGGGFGYRPYPVPTKALFLQNQSPTQYEKFNFKSGTPGVSVYNAKYTYDYSHTVVLANPVPPSVSSVYVIRPSDSIFMTAYPSPALIQYPDGNYTVTVNCAAGGKGTSTPTNYTLPNPGGVSLNVTCP